MDSDVPRDPFEPVDTRASTPTEPPPGDEAQDRDPLGTRLERAVMERLRRALLKAVRRPSTPPPRADDVDPPHEGGDEVEAKGWARGLELPRELLGVLLSQVDETKSGIYRVVAREVREFLSSNALSEELEKVLTRVKFEAKLELRFVPNARHEARERTAGAPTKSSIDRDRPSAATPPPKAPSPAAPTRTEEPE